MSVQDAITYTGISQACIAFLSLFSWFEIIHSVNSGQVGADLLKPMDYFFFWGAQDLGRALVNLVLRGLTIMVFYALVFDITVPDSPAQWIALVLIISSGLDDQLRLALPDQPDLPFGRQTRSAFAACSLP